MFTEDGIELKEGMKVVYRWKTNGVFEYTYTEQYGKYNLTWQNKFGRNCRKEGKSKYMFSTKAALHRKYPETEATFK